MRIEIREFNGYTNVCDSGNTEVITAWFSDQAKRLMSANSAMMPYHLWIWPRDERESEILSGPPRLRSIASDFSSKGLLAFAEAIMEAAARAKALEYR